MYTWHIKVLFRAFILVLNPATRLKQLENIKQHFVHCSGNDYEQPMAYLQLTGYYVLIIHKRKSLGNSEFI